MADHPSKIAVFRQRCRCCAARRSFARCALILFITLAGLALLARYVVAPLLFWRLAESCERPQHTVVGTLPLASADGKQAMKMQIRVYEPYLVAEVRLPKDISEAERRNLGFRQVAGYIFGSNIPRKPGVFGQTFPRMLAPSDKSEKISMTAPVQSEMRRMPAKVSMKDDTEPAADTAVVSFTMPSKYKSLSDLPVPLNRNVTLRAVEKHYAAVAGFRGPPPSAARIVQVQLAMENALAHAGVQLKRGSGPFLYQYHDPIATPSMLRWNEVVLLLEPQSVESLCTDQIFQSN